MAHTTWQAEKTLAEHIAQHGGDTSAVVRLTFTLSLPKRADRTRVAAVQRWLRTAPNYGVSIRANKRLFSRTWTVSAMGWGNGIFQWLWKGRGL